MVPDARAVAFYEEVFGARTVSEPIIMDDGRVGHVEIEIGDSVLMLADEFPEMGGPSPAGPRGTSVSLVVYVPDVDATFALAVELGATAERPPADQFHGSRAGWLVRPLRPPLEHLDAAVTRRPRTQYGSASLPGRTRRRPR